MTLSHLRRSGAQLILLTSIVLLPIGPGSIALGARAAAAPAQTQPTPGVCQVHGPVVGTVTYPTGWSFVSGPIGSCLRGALNPGYILSQNQTDYQTFDVGFNLGFPVGAWFYFPAGGTLELSQGMGAAVRRGPGPNAPIEGPLMPEVTEYDLDTDRWQAIGNIYACGEAEIVGGAAAVYSYSPTEGYQPTTTIPVGHAVWVWPSGDGPIRVQEPGDPASLFDPTNPHCS